MNLILTLIFFILLALIIYITRFYLRGIRFRSTSRVFSMKRWMNMSTQQRRSFDEQAMRKTMERKNILLDKIRKEYQGISDEYKENMKKSKENRKPPFQPIK